MYEVYLNFDLLRDDLLPNLNLNDVGMAKGLMKQLYRQNLQRLFLFGPNMPREKVIRGLMTEAIPALNQEKDRIEAERVRVSKDRSLEEQMDKWCQKADEVFAAVNKAKRNIQALLDVRPVSANLIQDGIEKIVKPEQVKVGEIIRVKVGERVPLDGEITDGYSSFNTAALTGESVPQTIRTKELVLAGMINLDKVVDLKVTKNYYESSLARILEMVQNATARKAPSELFIRKFAKVYTPIVVYLALTLVFLPYF